MSDLGRCIHCQRQIPIYWTPQFCGKDCRLDHISVELSKVRRQLEEILERLA